MRSLTNLFVGIEGDAYFAMFDFGMLLQVGHCGDYFGDSRLVVGSEQCGAVGHYKRLPLVVVELGEFSRAEHDTLFSVERDGLSVVVVDDARIYVASANVGRCVEVGDEADSRHMARGVGRQGRHEVSVVVKRNLGKAHFLQFLFEMLGKYHLAGGRWPHVGKFVALSVKLYIL